MAEKPKHKYIGNMRYRLVVLRITKRFPNGTPRSFDRLPEQGTARLSDDPQNNEFCTAYIPECTLDRGIANDND